MEATNKNKKEIEKIDEEIRISRLHYSKYFPCSTEYFKEHNEVLVKLKTKQQATIETSILWCEDEIEFLENLLNGWSKTMFTLRMREHLSNKIEQLQTHLTWLKEQEKKL